MDKNSFLNGQHILVVDHNAANRKVLTEMLSLWGCNYEEASNGQSALNKLKNALGKNDPFSIAEAFFSLLDQAG